MSASQVAQTEFQSAPVPLWREVLFGVDWLSLRVSPVYYGFGVPRGDGAPVIVIPGFLGSDDYLVEMYYWLRRIGYKPYYSRIGRNAECPELLTDRLFATIDRAQKDTGRKVHLIGHSLGGLLARSAAGQRPEQVAQVICLASPFRDIRVHPMVLAAAGFVRGQIARNNNSRKEKTAKRDCFTGACSCEFAASLRSDLPSGIDRTAIYTKTDGVVDWRSCVEEDDRLNSEVSGTHVGLAFNPQVYRKVANLLAGPR
ncbi:MAG: alpha/beta fold hydrolase [Dehalococcoidia bacterium]